MIKKSHFIRSGIFRFAFGSILAATSYTQTVASTLEFNHYPNAKIIQKTQAEVTDHPLVASSIKKVGGQLRVQQEVLLDGTLNHMLIQIPEGHTATEGFQFYLKQLEQHSAQFLFQCEGRDCGRSILWANDIFNNARLNGFDKDQAYVIATLPGQDHHFTMLYSTRRSNGQVLVLFDQFTADNSSGDQNWLEPDPQSVARILRQNGYYDLPGAWVNDTDLTTSGAYQFILKLLRNDSRLKLALVGQTRGGQVQADNWTQLIKQSVDEVTRVQQSLEKDGIDKARIKVLGVGPALSIQQQSEKPVLRLVRLD